MRNYLPNKKPRPLTLFKPKKRYIKKIMLFITVVVILLFATFVFVMNAYANQSYKTSKLGEYQTRYILVKTGDTLSSIFRKYQIPQSELQQIIDNPTAAKALSQLQPSQVLKIVLENKIVQRLTLEISDSRIFRAVRASEDKFDAYHADEKTEKIIHFAQGTIRSSLFSEGRMAGLSDETIMELARIFSWDIDFSKEIQRGDSFRVLYEFETLNGRSAGNSKILAAEFINAGKKYQAIRYTNPNGDTSYYTPEGNSIEKRFIQSPVKYNRISSRYSNNRWHPLLHRMRAHYGVDYAAPKGTPVKTTSDGKVIFRGYKKGYGNTVIIQHGKKYKTLYAHLRGFAKNLYKGLKLKQSQIIGYVGKSGLATGPHLHYEFYVNGKHTNPLKVSLPKAAPIDKKYLSSFVAYAQKRLAQLKQYSRRQLAAHFK